MKARIATLIGGGLALTLAATTSPSSAQQAAPPSNRVALVIGEGAYRSSALPAAPNDAGLVAETLAGAGFDVTGARDLDGDGLRGAVRDFLAKAEATGPDGIALVYFAGRALQWDGGQLLRADRCPAGPSVGRADRDPAARRSRPGRSRLSPSRPRWWWSTAPMRASPRTRAFRLDWRSSKPSKVNSWPSTPPPEPWRRRPRVLTGSMPRASSRP